MTIYKTSKYKIIWILIIKLVASILINLIFNYIFEKICDMINVDTNMQITSLIVQCNKIN